MKKTKHLSFLGKTLVSSAAAVSLSLILLWLSATVTKGQSSFESNVQLTIRSVAGHDKKGFSAEELIEIAVDLKNTSNDVVTVFSTCDTLDYEIRVTDESGASIALTTLGKRLTNRFDMMCRRKHVRFAA